MNRAQPFGRYELLDRISAGGMAEVFRARDAERGGIIVALKKILPHVAEDEEFIQMFSDEARIASSLEHPHIARTLDFGQIGSSYYIAFEYVRGKDLRAVFDRSVKTGEPIPLPFLLYVFARIGEGLSYAHARRDAEGKPVSIVHRDVSPQNIIVSFDGDVKLIDFGIAKAAGKLSRTGVGAIKGKFGYMSPEQVRGLEIDQRTDVFSLGITMWELLTRKRLFAAENELLVLEKIRNVVVPPPSSVDPTLPPGLDDILLRALAKNPDQRYQSAKELYRDLNILAQSGGKSASRADVAGYMHRAFADDAGPAVDSSAPPRSSGPTPSRPAGAGLSYNAENSMAADKSPAQGAGANDKRSDLDIFEGLGKKNGPSGPPSRAPTPPPPPSSLGDVGKKTLLGIAAPANAQAVPSMSRPPAPPSGAPPQRASLPAVTPPPQKSNPPPPPAATKPAPYGAAQSSAPGGAPASAGMDMDWDDDDEATHIFDKEGEGSHAGPMPSAPKPAAGAPAAGMPPAAPTAPLPRASAPPAPPRPPSSLSTTMGMAPPPPPGRGSAVPPPPPSAVGSSFARASGQVASSGPLINQHVLNQQAMTMPLGAQSSLGTAPTLAGQLHTEPLKMPPSRPPSAAPPPPPGTMPGGFGMTRPLQQNNPFIVQSGQSAAPMPMQPQMPMQQQQMMQQPQMPMQQQQQQMMQQHAYEPQQAPRAMEATALVRPPQSSKVGLIIAVLFALLAIAGAGVWFFVIPHTGNIAVNVTDSKGGSVGSLEVYLDGRKVCDTAPCRIDNVKAGSHELKVTAQGYDQPSPKLVAVESGKDEQEDFKLASAAAKGSGFKVTGTQPGVKLFVDDKEEGALPQEVRDLEPGSHKVKLVGTLKSAKGEDRYAPLEQTITVQKDEVQDLGTKTLKVLIGKATITLGTPGAAVKLVSSSGDQRTPTSFPVSIEIDTSKASWTIEATKFGMSPYKQPISFEDGQAEKVYNVQLDEKNAATGGGGGGSAPAYVYHPPTGGGGGGGGGGTTTAPSSGGAHLTINAIPVSGTIAILDGKPIGAVPKKDYAVSPGSHTILFINSGKSLRKSITVNVGEGESKPAFTKLDE